MPNILVQGMGSGHWMRIILNDGTVIRLTDPGYFYNYDTYNTWQ